MTPFRSLLSHKAGRIAAAFFGLAYLVTWVFGVPAVVSHNDQWVVDEFNRVVARGERRDVASSHPAFLTLAAVPAFPGLVISFRTYAIARRYGWGGVQADFWWPGAVRPWFKITLFVS
jgi:hypothetical protein